MDRHCRVTVIAVGCLMLCEGLPLRAETALQPPADCLLYASWSGRAQARRMTADTAFGKILAHPQLHRAAQALIEQAGELIKGQLQDEQSEALYGAVQEACRLLWESPGTFFLQNLDVGEQGLQVELALVVQAGPDVAKLQSSLLKIAEHLGLGPPIATTRDDGIQLSSFALLPTVVLSTSTINDYFVLSVGTAAVDHVAQLGQGGGLLANDEWALATSRMNLKGQPTLFTGFVNVAEVLERVPRIVQMFGGPDSSATRLQSLLTATGLADIQSWSCATTVQEAGFRRVGFLHTAQMDRGLFRLLKPTTIVDDDLAVIPADAGFAAALNFDFGSLREVLIGLLDSVEAKEDFQALEARLNEQLEFNFDQEFLQLLGDTVVIFDAPSTGGVLFSGLTMCLETDEPPKVQRGLSRMVELLAARFEPGMVQTKTYQYGQTDIHYVNVVGVPLPVAPAWAFHAHRLILALYPQMVINVIERLEQADRTGTLLANTDFGRGRMLLPAKPMSLCYVDTQRGVGQLYTLLLPVLQSLSGMAQAEGVNVDISYLPPRSAFVEPLFGDVSAVYAVDDGLLSVSHGPLAVAVPCVGNPTALAATLGATGLVLPRLNRPGENERVVSMARLKSIGTACHVYAYDNEGQFPNDLQILVDQGHLTAEVIEPTFIYIPQQDTNCDKHNVLAYERPQEDHEEQAVLFVDGHVELVDPKRCEKLVAETHQRLQARP